MQVSVRKDALLLPGFMIAWFVINCLQASLTGVDGDEAYYWVLSRHLDWGYFDHPPFVTLLIRLGESIAHGPLFTRLGTIILSTLTIGIIYKALPDDLKNAKYLILVFAGTVVLNVYSFIATPDAPLFFFASLFFLGYKKYLEKENISSVLLIAFSIAGMLYSKYHGILPVLFTIASNPKLLRRKSFWLIALIVSLALLPHIAWQWKHDWPTLRYHLYERNASDYKPEFTINYILGQVLVWGPFTFILFLRNILRVKTSDKLIKAHLFTFYGIFLFFFISSFNNSVEPHWTLASGISFVILFDHIIFHAKEKYRSVLKKVFYVNIFFILVARVLFAVPGSPFILIKNYKPFFEGKEWAGTVYEKAGNTAVIFMNSYILPSLYSFYYPQASVAGYNEKNYRKTQYSLTSHDCEMDGKPVLVFDTAISPDSNWHIKSGFCDGSLTPIPAFTCTNSLKIKPVNVPRQFAKGETIKIDLLVMNTGNTTIINRNNLSIDYAFFEEKYDFINSPISIPLMDGFFPAGSSKQIQIILTAPATKGRYNLLFSIVNPPFNGNFASQFYPVEIQ